MLGAAQPHQYRICPSTAHLRNLSGMLHQCGNLASSEIPSQKTTIKLMAQGAWRPYFPALHVQRAQWFCIKTAASTSIWDEQEEHWVFGDMPLLKNVHNPAQCQDCCWQPHVGLGDVPNIEMWFWWLCLTVMFTVQFGLKYLYTVLQSKFCIL